MKRPAKRVKLNPRAATPVVARPMTLVVTQVRQALQQTVAIGACSPYFPATRIAGPVQICFIYPL